MNNKLPISVEMVTNHSIETKSIRAGTEVKCWRCGNVFQMRNGLLYNPNAALKNGDTLPYVRCPYCRKSTSIVYYIDHTYRPDPVIKKERRRRQYVGNFSTYDNYISKEEKAV